ncbi:MAG: diaminopimelate epimerase [Longimicrobiales bacterium]|jgi:diaminopimelate epimerase|nr:diaminopimelate epimerase [Longimicrobiales bacterium]
MTNPGDSVPWLARPVVSSRFYKAHGLGNDYIVFEAAPASSVAQATSMERAETETWIATPDNVALVCDPHRGVGSDGIVVVDWNGTVGKEDPATHIRVSLRMFNPDGGEFERSGNGLRVVASYLATWIRDLEIIDSRVGGEEVHMRVHGVRTGVFDVSVDMGQARSGPAAIGAAPGLIDGDQAPYSLNGPEGEELEVVPVSVGNPHLVVLTDGSGRDDFSEERLAVLGPFFAAHPGIPGGTNVQLARSVDGRIEAFIWERGVGRTSASGTSSCAVAVALVLAGRIPPGELRVHMPGGTLQVRVSESLDVGLRGPVESVMTGSLEPGLLARFEPGP